MDVIISRVEYRSSVFIKTVFEATFNELHLNMYVVHTRRHRSEAELAGLC